MAEYCELFIHEECYDENDQKILITYEKNNYIVISKEKYETLVKRHDLNFGEETK